MRTYRVALTAYPQGFKPLKVEVDGEWDVSRLETVELAGQPMVRIGDWLVSRDKIVAIVPEDAKERQRIQFR